MCCDRTEPCVLGSVESSRTRASPDSIDTRQDELREVFALVGVPDMPQNTPAVVNTCGSGLTAAILALALHEIGEMG